MAAMIRTTPRVPSMPSTESEYHRFNLHRLTEASSKLSYGNNDPSPYAPDRQTYYQDSTPDLDSEDMNNGGFFSGISDNRFEGLQLPSQVESSLDQLQSYVAQSPVAQAKNSIFGGNQPTPMSHFTNCEELSLLTSNIYDKNQLLDEHSSPMEVPLTSAKRSRRVTVVKFPESGKTIARVRRAPRLRKASAEKAERPKLPKLHQPLSELTQNYHHLPVRDMDSWVNRTESVRHEEVTKRSGYITRPMNSFMLYRSAYAERTKLWCLQNNHQVVSAVSGESWPLEPEYIRCKYNDLARIERMNHQAAHPGYKFSPSKSQSTRKRKGAKEADQSEASDLEDPGDNPEYVENGSDKRKRLPRHAKKQTKGANFQEGPIIVNKKYLDLSGMGEGGASRSSFAATNPGKTPPICMGSTDMTGQYYQTTVQASRATPVPNGDAVIEDVTIQKTQGPGRSSNPPLCQPWMTSGVYTGDYGWSQEGLEEAMQENSKVDPLLLVQDYGNSQLGAFENQTAQCGVTDDIDEGFEMGTFDIDPLFQTDMEGTTYQEIQNTGGEQNFCENFEGYGTSPIDSAIDIHSLPAYHDSMHGFMDNNDPWTIIKDEGSGPGLKYDEWLQE
ncbi:hypothetical protein BGX38DRAFT_1144617 [Terfezia claveryi]|nr:hypothetical protein BGX38DRAFT_1144617 [Terfezia claveryi]